MDIFDDLRKSNIFEDLDKTYTQYLKAEAENAIINGGDPWPFYENIYKNYCQNLSEAYLSGCEWYRFINSFKTLKEAYFAAKVMDNRDTIECVIGECFVDAL